VTISTATDSAAILTVDHVRTLRRDETPDDYRDNPGELAGPYVGTLAEILAELHDAVDVDLDSRTWLRGSTLWVAPAQSVWVLLDDATKSRGNVIRVGTRSEIAGHHMHMGRRRLDIASARWVGDEPPVIGARVVRTQDEAWS
jgi:hypothetical protein